MRLYFTNIAMLVIYVKNYFKLFQTDMDLFVSDRARDGTGNGINISKLGDKMKIDAVTNTISVHGREALDLPYSRWSPDDSTIQLDISGATMYLEIPAANLRKLLVVNPDDPLGLRIVMSRSEVSLLPTVPTPYIILDETDPMVPVLELESRIYRTGYTNEPSE
jgi:hypothetical protein